MRKKILVLLACLVAIAITIAPKTMAVDNPQDLQNVIKNGVPWQPKPPDTSGDYGTIGAGVPKNASEAASLSADSGTQGADNAPDEDGLFAKLLGTFLYGINGALKALNFPTMDKIIFQGVMQEGQSAPPRDDWGFYVFTDDQMQGGDWSLLGMYRAMQVLAWIFLIYLVVVTGLKVAYPSKDPARRLNLQTAIGDIIVTAMFLALSWAPFYVLGQLNHMLVSSVTDGGMMTREAIATQVKMATHSGFMTELAVLIFNALGIVFLALYFMRMFALALLFVVSPLIALLWLSPPRRMAVRAWLGEVAANMFLQSIHVLLFAIFLALEHNSKNWWEWILFAAAIIPLGNLGRQLITSAIGAGGDHGAVTMGALAGAGAITGMIAVGSHAAGKGISMAGGRAQAWLRSRSESGSAPVGGGGGGFKGGVPTAGGSGGVVSSPAMMSAMSGGGLSEERTGALATPPGVTPAEAAAKGTTGVVGKYSPKVLEGAHATRHAATGSRIGSRVAGAVGAAMGGAMGATIGLASSLAPGAKTSVADLAKSGAQIGRAAFGGAGSALGGAAGMVSGSVKGIREHYGALKAAEQAPQGGREHFRAMRQGLHKALGYDQAPPVTRTLQLAGGFAGSFAGATGTHLGAAAGHRLAHTIARREIQDWIRQNSGGMTPEHNFKAGYTGRREGSEPPMPVAPNVRLWTQRPF